MRIFAYCRKPFQNGVRKSSRNFVLACLKNALTEKLSFLRPYMQNCSARSRLAISIPKRKQRRWRHFFCLNPTQLVLTVVSLLHAGRATLASHLYEAPASIKQTVETANLDAQCQDRTLLGHGFTKLLARTSNARPATLPSHEALLALLRCRSGPSDRRDAGFLTRLDPIVL